MIQNKIKTLNLWLFNLCLGGQLIACPLFASTVTATTTSLQAIVKELVPSSIAVISLSKPGQDPHHLEIEAKHIQWIKKSDIVIAVGFDFESSWLTRLLKASKSTANVFYVGLKLNSPIEMGKTSGHNHHRFNPHFVQSPDAVLNFVIGITDELQRVFPDKKSEIQTRLQKFINTLTEQDKKWRQSLEGISQRQLIAYHESLEYFAKNYNLQIVGHIEEAHGVSPSPLHIKRLLKLIKDKNINCIAYDSFYSSEQLSQVKKLFPKHLKWMQLPAEVGAMPKTDTYFLWQESLVRDIKACLL